MLGDGIDSIIEKVGTPLAPIERSEASLLEGRGFLELIAFSREYLESGMRKLRIPHLLDETHE